MTTYEGRLAAPPSAETTVWPFALAMALVVVASNVLVQFPVMHGVAGVDLSELLTWGAFTYPLAFLVNDLTNRAFGPAAARRVVGLGFLLAVICSVAVPPLLFRLGLFPFEMEVARLARIAVASGTAFLVAQLLDVAVFDRLNGRGGRGDGWWRAPLFSTGVGSVIDTALFFTLAFAASLTLLGPTDGFATETSPLVDAPRWVVWAAGDLAVKVAVGLAALGPYWVVMRRGR